MRYHLVVLFIFISIVVPSQAFATRVEDLFYNSYNQLLKEVADASPLFEDPVSVKRAIESQDSQARILRLRKRIAIARMLVADGQLQSGKKVSYLFTQMTASRLIKAGEKWVLMAQARVDEEKGEEEKKEIKEEGEGETQRVQEEQEKPEEEVIIIVKEKRDNRFDIFDDDEFNLYDVLAFPFRLIGMILELLFNILLFPFKLLTQILF